MEQSELQEKLGIEPGSTLTALVALAEELCPEAPWDAFEPLWFVLPWLKPGVTLAQVGYATPKNVLPFAETGGDLNHFGFLMDRELPTEERPIVFVAPRMDDASTVVVAPNLRGLLSLLSISFGEVVDRHARDAEWLSFRQQSYGDDPRRLEQMQKLSERLWSIPGVERPTNPSRIANAHPALAFRLDHSDDDEPEPDPQAAEAAYRSGMGYLNLEAGYAFTAMEEERFGDAIRHALEAVGHPAFRARCLFVLATCYQHVRDKRAAEEALEKLLRAWLDPAWVEIPGVHARRVVEQDDLIALVKKVKGWSARSAIRKIREAPDLEEPSGDFF